MIFLAGQAVLWQGEDCVVELVRDSGMVALSRARDGFTIITSAIILELEQPAGAQVAIRDGARHSLLGDA